MPFDYGLRLNNRQRIANAREKPIEANKNQSVDGAEGLFLRSGSPQNVYLLPQRQNFRLERCPRQKQIYDHPSNEPDKISHPATASPDSRSTASQIEFATGTAMAQALPKTQSLLFLNRSAENGCYLCSTAEHVVDAAASLAVDILRSAPGVRLLPNCATSSSDSAGDA
jgi:hypothetical protein